MATKTTGRDLCDFDDATARRVFWLSLLGGNLVLLVTQAVGGMLFADGPLEFLWFPGKPFIDTVIHILEAVPIWYIAGEYALATLVVVWLLYGPVYSAATVIESTEHGGSTGGDTDGD